MAAPVQRLAALLIGAGVDGSQTTHLIRTLRAVIHGFVDLEMKDGFGMPVDIGESFERAIDVVTTGVLEAAR